VAEAMKETLRYIAKQTGGIVPFKWLNRLSYPLLLPFYHVVSNEKLHHIHNYQYRNEQEFIGELDFLLRHFEPVELHELLKPEIQRKKVFHLSFDDGLRQCYDVIAPILTRKGIPATFFVNPAFADNRQLFHRYKASLLVDHIINHPSDLKYLTGSGYDSRSVLSIPYHLAPVLDDMALKMGVSWNNFLNDYKPYMTEGQIQQLINQGFTIGAHSWDHPEFWLLNEEEQLQQIIRSMDWVSEKFNPKLKVFAFPYTDDGVTSSLLAHLTEKKICDLTFGTAGLKSDTVTGHLQRLPCETNSSLGDILRSEMAYGFIRRLFGKSRVKHL
jgi:peptidoglycan/xylan/chitin deacetylase (PgdA/CDA1 family)